MELKNGETYNGHLVNCDTWMNIHLREVICTSKVNLLLNQLQVVLLIYVIVVASSAPLLWLGIPSKN